MYASLSSSYQWNMMNHNNAITTRISEIMKEGTEVSYTQMETTFSTIRNRIRTPLLKQLLEYLKDGNIRMVYCDKVKIPLYLPFIVLQPSKGSYVGIVFLNHCECTIGDTIEGGSSGEYLADARKLRVALESCYFAIRMIQLDSANNTKLTAPDIIRPATKIYTHIVLECINRKYNIKLDQSVYNQLQFMVSRYFIGTVLGYNPDSNTMENYCLYNCMNPDLASIRIVNDQFTPEDFTNFGVFMDKLVKIPELQGRIGKLNVSSFVQMFVNLYNAPMTLGLEVFPYLVFNILSVTNSTYVNNYHILKNIVGDDGNKLYGYLVTILG